MRAQLARILASEIFSRSDRLTAFLTFIVEQSLDGRGVELKEHVLAMEVYSKSADFDTGVDPIVRVDARRLRDKLREYYASAPHDPIVIAVPRGSYAPTFETNGHATLAAVDAIRPAPTFKPRVWSVRGGMVVLGVCASLALAIGWRNVAAKPPSLRILTVTSFPGAEGMPSLSPDGNFVGFTWRGVDTTEAADVWVKAVDGDELRRLTNTPQFHEAMPAWSPDGRQIAYYRLKGVQNDGVFLVSPLGGPERKIADQAGAPAWTPDGQSLVMTSAAVEEQGIFLQVLETGARRRLTHTPDGFSDGFPKVSPDGKTVAFTREKSAQSALLVVPITGGEPTRLTERGEVIGRLDWTPDGREILYPQLDTSGMRIFESPRPPDRRPHLSPACRSASTCSRCRDRGADRSTVWRSGTGNLTSAFDSSISSRRRRREYSRRLQPSATRPASTCPGASREMAATWRSSPTATAMRKSGWRAATSPSCAA